MLRSVDRADCSHTCHGCSELRSGCSQSTEYSNGTIVCENPKRFGVKIGFFGSEGVPSYKGGYFGCEEKGTVIFKGKASIGKSNSIRVSNGVLSIGDGFSSNTNCFISCSKGITIGERALLGFNISIRDSDGHQIYENGQERLAERAVKIGNHVWICSHADVLKGAVIGDDSVVGYKACLSSRIGDSNVLIAGVPAKIVKTGINWEK